MISLLPGYRRAACIVMLAFSWHVLDVPVFLAAGWAKTKTCCGRAVCLCKHPRGGKCHFKEMQKKHLHGEAKRAASAPSMKHCHFPKAEQKNTGVQNAAVSANPEHAAPVFQKAPCASDASKTAFPGYARDLCGPAKLKVFNLDRGEAYALPPLHLFRLLHDGRRDRPPQILLSSGL